MVEIEILDPQAYGEYVERIPPVVHRHGGRYVVRGGRVTPLAGGWDPDRVIVVEFPDEAALYAFVASDDYRELAVLRENSTRTRSIVLEGVEQPPG